MRERLHARYLHPTGELGRHWEAAGDWAAAAACYERGFGVDALVEEYYQRLMICHQRREHRVEAMSVYRRCSKALRTYLDIAPSPETDGVYRSICEEPPIDQLHPPDQAQGGIG